MRPGWSSGRPSGPGGSRRWPLRIRSGCWRCCSGGLGGVAVWQWRAAERALGWPRSEPGSATAETARGLEAKARGEAERQREKFERFEYGRTIQVAHQEWREANVAAALALLDGTRPDLRGWEWRYVHRLCHSDLLTLKGHTGHVYWASFSPDGSRIVTASGDRTANVWDARTGAVVLTLKGHADAVHSASFSPDGSRIVTAEARPDGEGLGRQDRCCGPHAQGAHQLGLVGVVQPGRVADRHRER